MKKTLVVGLAIGLVSVAITTAFAIDRRPDSARTGALPTQGGMTYQKNFGTNGILGSSHDMSGVVVTSASTTTTEEVGATNADAQSRICVYCHHPHNARTHDVQGSNLEYSPLWDRVDASNDPSRTGWSGYNNGIMMGSQTAMGTDKRHALNAADEAGALNISGVSLLCMSCHDGVTAMSAYSQNIAGTQVGSTDGAGNGNATSSIGTSPTSSFEGNMNNHHPMGFNYAAVQGVDQEIAPTTAVMVPQSGITIGELLYGPEQKMECVTCHDVHNTANQKNAERFLWRSNNKSNFCLTCHLK